MRIGRAAALVASVALAACPAGAAAADSPVGVHSMLQLTDPYSFMQSMFAEAAAAHASAIRLDVAPAIVFTDPSGPPDFSGMDEVIALSKQYQIPVVADLFTIPWWIANCQVPTSSSQTIRCGTDDLADYQSMLSQIVAHADPVIRDWEIWNEPDTGYFFRGTPSQYAAMLRTAHDAIKKIDPQAEVLLGGISSTSGMDWLAQVFAVTGSDAAHAFDIANVHERGGLRSLASDVASWKRFLAGYGFTGPLWVTEHGYPSDPAYQYDSSYGQGPASQAAYLTASIPTLIDAGASEVLVTERDNLGGQFASEGLLGGDVLDPPVSDPQVVEKPAYAAVGALAQCYINAGRDCPGPTPVASWPSVSIPATLMGSSTDATVSFSDPGPEPLQLGAVTIAPQPPGPIAVQADGCSDLILEPNETCTVTLRFTPAAGGTVDARLSLPSDNGTLSIPVTAVAPAVSSLTVGALAFKPVGTEDGVGHMQRLAFELTNPLSVPIHVTGAALSGPAAGEFAIESDGCSRVTVSPRAGCQSIVLFTARRSGTARATLTLSGDGTPLQIPLSANAFALPAIAAITSPGRRLQFVQGGRKRIVVIVTEPAGMMWRAAGRGGVFAGRSSAGGRIRWAFGRRGYVADLRLPLRGSHGMPPGRYRLTVVATNSHGSGAPRSAVVTVLP